MGDILGAILGTSSTTTQKTQPDPLTMMMNTEKYKELQRLLSTGSLYNFGGAQPELYSPTPLSHTIGGAAENIIRTPLDYSNLMSLDDYRNSFAGVTGDYSNALQRTYDTSDVYQGRTYGDYEAARAANIAAQQGARERSYADYGVGTGAAADTYAAGRANVNQAYNSAIARGDYDLARTISLSESGGYRALGENYANYNRGVGAVRDATGQTLALNDINANRGLGLNEANYLRSLGVSELDAQRSLATQDFNRARALELGIGATGNYVDQIARPRLEQVMALQGLESGAALPAAIARATAEQAMPYLQSIENAYGTNQANTLNNLMGLRGEFGTQRSSADAAVIQTLMQLQTATGQQRTQLEAALAQQLAGLQNETTNAMAQRNTAAAQATGQSNAALSGQLVGSETQLASNYQNNVNQLAQALMANNITLEQAGISAQSALGQSLMQAQTALRTQTQQGITSLANTYIPQASSFIQSLPQASSQLSLIPQAMQTAKAANLTALQPIADFQRQLSEADFLRRQGLFTTAYTGIPYTPGGTVASSNATGNLFNNLGGFFTSFGTGGTKGGSGSVGFM